jgi:glutamate synthase (NADPH/NADH) small chain
MVSLNPLPNKERMKIPRQHMPEQDAHERAHNFKEVNLGLPTERAKQEALRCIARAEPTCVIECPVGVKVREFIDLVLAEDYLGAAAKLPDAFARRKISAKACVLNKKGDSLAIGYLERFVADHEQKSGKLGLPAIAKKTGKKVAIVGSGPAGLSCAGDLVQKGHEVRVFEALHQLGGVLVYGIPEFRLPRDVVRQEIHNLRHMGVEFETNVIVGKTVTIDELMQNEHYDAIFVATGAGLPVFLNIPGEHLVGVFSANEFLTRVNLMRAYRFPDYDEPLYDCKDKDVVVIGGGNTAMDAVRTSLRLGAKSAALLYRRSEAEMPARKEEIEHAKQEGVEFQTLVNPVAFLGDEHGHLSTVRCQRMELGEPDASGRRRPVPSSGSEFTRPAALAIIAAGTTANPMIQSTTPDLKTNKWRYIEADPETQRTSKPGVFAGGDIVTGGATVILAMGAGRKAAKSVHEYLTTGNW